MPKVKNFLLSHSAVICVASCLLLYLTFIQFISATFYDPDSYYHAAVTNFIKNFGFKYQFHWAQFSLFKDFFSDKDFLFHFLSLPFFYFTDNLVAAGKQATIFYNILFIFVYAFILRKYLSDFLAALFLLLPALSSTFVAFSSQFRSVTLSNILTLLAIYFIINKRLPGVFIVSLLYPLAHISFFMLIPFVLICEVIRYAVNKEFSLRNLYTMLIGMLLGMFIHPNFPNNFLSFHLNGILVPLYTITRVKMDFGGEFNSPLSSFAFVNNFTVFFTINLIIWMSFFVKKKWGFSTLAWLGCSNIYLALSFFSNRYWYPANILFYVFFASYVRDIIEGVEWKKIFPKVGLFIGLYLVANLIVFPMNLTRIEEYIYFFSANNIQYTKFAEWMKRNIPAGETVYHASWSDSPYFICLNPKNNYINVLDPIYMFYRYPKEFSIYQNLIWGKVEKPYEPLREVFKVNYGFTRKETPLYFQIIADPKHFKISYENNMGIVFKLI